MEIICKHKPFENIRWINHCNVPTKWTKILIELKVWLQSWVGVLSKWLSSPSNSSVSPMSLLLRRLSSASVQTSVPRHVVSSFGDTRDFFFNHFFTKQFNWFWQSTAIELSSTLRCNMGLEACCVIQRRQTITGMRRHLITAAWCNRGVSITTTVNYLTIRSSVLQTIAKTSPSPFLNPFLWLWMFDFVAFNMLMYFFH